MGRYIEAYFKIPKLSSKGRHNLESNRKKGKIRKSGILGGETPQKVCFNMVKVLRWCNGSTGKSETREWSRHQMP
jgi:hypothetical protein